MLEQGLPAIWESCVWARPQEDAGECVFVTRPVRIRPRQRGRMKGESNTLVKLAIEPERHLALFDEV